MGTETTGRIGMEEIRIIMEASEARVEEEAILLQHAQARTASVRMAPGP